MLRICDRSQEHAIDSLREQDSLQVIDVEQDHFKQLSSVQCLVTCFVAGGVLIGVTRWQGKRDSGLETWSVEYQLLRRIEWHTLLGSPGSSVLSAMVCDGWSRIVECVAVMIEIVLTVYTRGDGRSRSVECVVGTDEKKLEVETRLYM